MIIVEVLPTDEKVLLMVEELDRANKVLYPEGPNYLESPTAMVESSTMLGVFQKEELIGIGAIKWAVGYGEVKRVFVALEFRGQGLAKLIMLELEKLALNQGVTILRLETGVRQEAAIGLYKSLKYKEIEPFGDYQMDPMSLFFEKELAKKLK